MIGFVMCLLIFLRKYEITIIMTRENNAKGMIKTLLIS